ncbi:MAG: hypothetical protein JSR97_02550 [Verrucomicrobia bacterium]|nr:hypothetical protein [Verrucomicrobiota bacterium]
MKKLVLVLLLTILFLPITFAQNVGIGTTTPVTRLHVSGTQNNIATFNGGGQMWITLSESSIDRGYIGSFSGNPEDVDFGTYLSNTTGKVHLTTSNLPRLSVNSSGNVGIGIIDPEARLHLRTTNWIKTIFDNGAGQPRGYIGTDNNGSLTLSSNAYWNGSAWVYPNTGSNSLSLLLHQPNEAFEFRVRPDGGSQSTAMVVKVNGNVGIGTNNPAAKLDINGDVNIQNRVLLNNAAGNAGQALISNGNASSPTWQNIAYSNNDRFMFVSANNNFYLGEFVDTILYTTAYALSGAVSYNSNGVFTINKSGLYAIKGNFSATIASSAAGTAHSAVYFYPSGIYAKLGNQSKQLVANGANFIDTETFSIDMQIYFSAGSTFYFYGVLSSGPSISYSSGFYQSPITINLISE